MWHNPSKVADAAQLLLENPDVFSKLLQQALDSAKADLVEVFCGPPRESGRLLGHLAFNFVGLGAGAGVKIISKTGKVEDAVEAVGKSQKIEDLTHEAAAGAIKGTAGSGVVLPAKYADRLPEIERTLELIEKNGPFPYKQDGSIFRNKENLLPEGSYREYTVETKSLRYRGQRRIVQETVTGKLYYTDDHYETFYAINKVDR